MLVFVAILSLFRAGTENTSRNNCKAEQPKIIANFTELFDIPYEIKNKYLILLI